MPANLVEIGDSAFARSLGAPNTRMTSLVIPEKVKTIGAMAFYNYQRLETVEVKSTVLKKPGEAAFGQDSHDAFSTEKEIELGDGSTETAIVGTSFLTPNEEIKVLFESGDNCYLGEVSPMVRDPENDVEPTCTAEGRYAYLFTFHGKTEPYYQERPALGHDYQFDRTVAPSCTTNQYDLYVCTHDATHTERRNMVENSALGHNYQVSKITNDIISESRDTIIEYTCQRENHDGSSPKVRTITIPGTTLKGNTTQSLSDLMLTQWPQITGGTLQWADGVNTGDDLVYQESTQGMLTYPVTFTSSIVQLANILVELQITVQVEKNRSGFP